MDKLFDDALEDLGEDIDFSEKDVEDAKVESFKWNSTKEKEKESI